MGDLGNHTCSTGFNFADEYGEGKIVRPVAFTQAFQKNTGSTPQGGYLHLKKLQKLHILVYSQMIWPLFMHFQTEIFFTISWTFITPVEMYTCSNTALCRKRKNTWFCFFIFKPPPLFFDYIFFVQTCAPDHSHRALLSRPLTLLVHLCFLLIAKG